MQHYQLADFSVIVACDDEGGIGKEEMIPWDIKEDRNYFRRVTKHGIVIMGRKTYESLPEKYRPLPKRVNIVISTTMTDNNVNVTVVDSLFKALKISRNLQILEKIHRESNNNNDNINDIEQSMKKYNKENRVWLIGGKEVIEEGMTTYRHLLRKAHVTYVRGKYDCDVILNMNIFNGYHTAFEAVNISKMHETNIYVYDVKSPEDSYLEVVAKILTTGEIRNDRTGVGTMSIFGDRMEFDISKSIPLLTTKKVLYKKVISELLWFISGSTDVKDLQKRGVNFWNANSSREFLDNRGLDDYEEGDLGPVYGHQWRHSGAPYVDCKTDYNGLGVDQLNAAIDTIKNNPDCRRIIISSWVPGDIDKMALPPCHCLFQFYVRYDKINGKRYLDCQLYQRSCDMFLGVPFNIASYTILTYMIAHLTNLKPGRFIHVLGDAHVYLNHLCQAKKMLSRTPKPLPTLSFNRTPQEIGSIDNFIESDFIVENYDPWPYIKAEMAV